MIKERLREIGLYKAAVIYAVVICAVYSPVVFYGRTLSAGARYPWFGYFPPQNEKVMTRDYPNTFNVDIASPAAYEEPIDLFIGNQLRKGIYPLWNPFIACGSLLQESFSTRVLFPYQLLQNIFPWSMRDFFLLGRIFLAAIGVFIYLMIFGASFYPALTGGALYGLSGAMTVFLTLTQMSNVGMMLPYALLGSELVNRRQNILAVACCSVSLALLILAGQPETAFYALVFIFFYFVVRTLTTKKEELRSLPRKCFAFTGAAIIALLISSPFFVPFLFNNQHYFSLHPPGGTQGISGFTPPENFAAILLPEMLKWRTETYGFTYNYGWDRLGGYTGIAGLFLILAAFKTRWWGRRSFLFFLVFTSLILFKNAGAPFINWIGKLPFFDQVWTPRWAGPVWNLSFTLCAALAFQAILETPRLPRPEDMHRHPPVKFFLFGMLLLQVIIEAAILYTGVLFNLNYRLKGWLLTMSINSGFTVTQLWNMVFILLWMTGVMLLFLLHCNRFSSASQASCRARPWSGPAVVFTAIIILGSCIFVNTLLWSVLTGGQNEIVRRMHLSTKHLLQAFCIFMSVLIIAQSIKKMRFSPFAAIFCFLILACLFNFQAQAQQIAGAPVKSIFAITDKDVFISFFVALWEAVVFAVGVVVALDILWHHPPADKNIFALFLSSLVILESMFHVTIGYGERTRMLLLAWYLCALLFLSGRFHMADTGFIKKGAAIFFTGLLGLGALGIPSMPQRSPLFNQDYYRELNLPQYGRIMGLRGAFFPNASSALGAYDVRSIVSLSIERFQLFQDYCLLRKPQEIYKRLWFTGLIDDSGSGKTDIIGSVKERYHFYALAGVSNFLSYSYEDIPHTRLIQEGNLKNYESVIAMPRVFIVHEWSAADTPLASLRWMLENAFLLNSQAVVEGRPACEADRAQSSPSGEARIISYGLHSVVIEAETSAPGVLVLTDVYHPDWKVTLNGKPAEVFPADLCFRGVFLAPGKHEVKFTYRPVVFYYCVLISLLSFTILTILTIRSLKIYARSGGLKDE